MAKWPATGQGHQHSTLNLFKILVNHKKIASPNYGMLNLFLQSNANDIHVYSQVVC